ncbi:pentatricopeptide repeat-containing protein At5g57250, mitochondrial [Henckelia pumila]|uniref:pentatricopeptide repeat-containing protein At5g57250, mitochondrial n=1 Tax=Henckelia pumila TaxID=405737 RepID=UPI003C6E5AC6
MLSLSALLKSGFTPTPKNFNKFLRFLYQNKRFEVIIHVFCQFSSNTLKADIHARTIFTKALLKVHKFDEAAEFLKTLLGKSGIFQKNRIFDSLIQGLCTFSKDPEKGLSLLKDFLKTDGSFPSSRTFFSLIYCFNSTGKMDRVIEVVELMADDKFKYPFDNFVCSSVISGFVRIGEPGLAVEFYENAVKYASLKPNTVTCTSVLTAYCSLGKVDKISELVSWMESNELAFDVVFYSNWIYGCLKEGLIDEALQRYRAMEDRKVQLDIVGYSILVDGFSKEGHVEKAVGILYKMRMKGLEPNLVTYTAIILGFCRKGKLEEAFAIFSMLKTSGIKIDEFTYAILIHGACKKRNFDLVFHLLVEMEKRGINPGVVTYNTIINGLCKVGRTAEADNFSKAIVGDVVTYSTLLHGYIQEQSASGILDTKRRLEKAGIHKDVIMCNILIKALLLVGLFEDALSIYKGLPQMDLTANSVTYTTLIDGYCKSGRIGEALEIFDEFQKTSNSSAACYNCIISGLCKKGMVGMALDIFIEYIKKGLPLNETIYMMLIKTTLDKNGDEGVLNAIARINHLRLPAMNVVFNDAICFLCKMGFTEASCNILFLMKNSDLELTNMCYYSIIRALLSEGKKLFALHILTSFVKKHGMYDLRVSKTLVHYLCLSDVKKALVFLSIMNDEELRVTIPAVFETLIDGGRVLDAYELLIRAENNLPVMNVVDYSIMVDALCKDLHIEKALDLCSFAKKKGVALNTVTYNSVIHGLCRQGCLVEAFRLFDSMEITGVAASKITYGTLVDALVKEGLLLDARTLFERMFLKNLQPNTHIYNSLINGYCNSSLLEEAIKLFRNLEVRNLKPDCFTVSALINGYCHKGDMEGALNLYFEFRSKGLLPDFLGFLPAIRGLSAKGRMEESRSILKEMLQTPSVIALLRKIDSEVKSDSVENLLGFLCEQGNILEAVTLLGEVESTLFSGRKNSSYRGSTAHDLDTGPLILGENGTHLASSVVEPLEDMMKIWSDEYGKTQQLRDFDSFYALVHSLCIKGELVKANRLTKLIMEI